MSSRALVFVADALVLILTWVKTFGIRKAAREAGIEASISALITRDGEYASTSLESSTHS